MAGCRYLTEEEVQKIINCLPGIREQSLFVLGYTSGFRISELLSVKILDVYNARTKTINDSFKVSRKNMKGKTESRELPINPKAKIYLNALISLENELDLAAYLFRSRSNNSKNKRLSRISAHHILKEAFQKAGLTGTGTLATHSMRKTFAINIYEASQYDLILVKQALGHSSVTTTEKYLPLQHEKLKDLINSIK